MAQRDLDLSRLIEFVNNTLTSTDEVKNTLKAQCEEAKFVLAPWQFETITRRELDKNSCTCIGVLSSEDHVREIASGIDKAVAQARKLREKLATNISEEKKLARRPSVQQIYASSYGEGPSRTKLVESKAGKKNGSLYTAADKPADGGKGRVVNKRSETYESGQRRQSALINGDNPCPEKNSKILNVKGKSARDKILGAETLRSASNAKKILGPKQIADKKLIGTSPYNSLVSALKAEQKSKGKKNFIAANKSSVKNMKSSKSGAGSGSRIQSPRNLIHDSEISVAEKSSDSLLSRAQSAAEIENLISKISLESENGFIKSDANLNEGNSCPFHDINAPKFIEEKVCTSVDVAEGLDRFGVPSELVKILKVYHNYLNSQSTCKPGDKRGKKAAGRFLEEFGEMNRVRRKASIEGKLENLCNDFLPVFRESYNRKMDFIELSKLKIRYTDLDSTCKTLQIRSISPTYGKLSNLADNRCSKNSLERNRTWILNSVWNEACIPSLEGMSRARCIRYSNKNQLLELFDVMQRAQQLKYQGSLVDLLINEVVPLIKHSLEPTSAEYISAYKMISIVSNLFHLRVPVLVSTDK